MKVGNFETSKLEGDQFQRYCSKMLADIVRILNKGILPGDNYDASIISVGFVASNSDTKVTHALNRVPTGYYPLNLSAAMIVYNGTVAASENEITLKSSAAGTALMLIF
jgi:hypothetical protein